MKQKTRRIITPILIFIFALILCSCQSNTVPTDTGISTAQNNTSTNETHKINIPETDMPNDDRVKTILAQMTLEEKVAQMFFVRCPDIGSVETLENYALGGYVLFGRDFKDKTPADVINTIETYQNTAKIPLLIGVDEEGGNVVRASWYPEFRESPFLSPQNLFEQGGYSLIQLDTIEKISFLKNLGINVNLAPVCDISTNPDDFIYSRSFGQSPENTSVYTSMVVAEMKSSQMGSVLKHFPGYGNNADTHTGIAYDSRPFKQLETEDFLPFKAGIIAGADSVLVSHNVIESIDAALPASLSPAINAILRKDLAFNGVIMTDDMAMEGVKNFSNIDTAVLAIIAGNDLIITSDHQTQIANVLDAVKKGEISTAKIDASVERILTWKINLGIL